MWIAIVVVGFVVLGLAAYAALGKLGEMRPDAITDSPKGRVPDTQVDAEFLQGLVIPLRTNGYSPQQVDAFLVQVVAGTAGPAAEARFDVVRRGYDMSVVDDILDRVLAREWQEPGFGMATDAPFVAASPPDADAQDGVTPRRGRPADEQPPG